MVNNTLSAAVYTAMCSPNPFPFPPGHKVELHFPGASGNLGGGHMTEYSLMESGWKLYISLLITQKSL